MTTKHIQRVKDRWNRVEPSTGYNNIIKFYLASPNLKLLLNLPDCFNITPEQEQYHMQKLVMREQL